MAHTMMGSGGTHMGPPLRIDLTLVEDKTHREVKKCAMYRRRNMFMFQDGSAAMVHRDGSVMMAPDMTSAMAEINKNPGDYPY